MDRLGFCNLMEQAKTCSNLTPSEISFSMKMLMPTLRRFEKGNHNFSMTKVMEYLKVLSAKLIVHKGSSKKIFTDYEQLISWIILERKKSFSQRTLAEAVGMSYVMLARVESQKSNLTIDVFLKIVDILGCSIEIKPTISNKNSL